MNLKDCILKRGPNADAQESLINAFISDANRYIDSSPADLAIRVIDLNSGMYYCLVDLSKDVQEHKRV